VTFRLPVGAGHSGYSKSSAMGLKNDNMYWHLVGTANLKKLFFLKLNQVHFKLNFVF
jgi:hypothetical protein